MYHFRCKHPPIHNFPSVSQEEFEPPEPVSFPTLLTHTGKGTVIELPLYTLGIPITIIAGELLQPVFACKIEVLLTVKAILVDI